MPATRPSSFQDLDSMATMRDPHAAREGASADAATGPLGRVDQYELVRKLGGGGFGVVYLARDTASGIDVALKTLHPALKHDAEELDRLRSKFALVARLAHPNIATALVLHPAREIDIPDEIVRRELRLSPGDPVMVMRYAPGVTLSRWRLQFPDGVVPHAQAVAIVRQIAAALDHAHAERIVHRDIKPANIMVETLPDGTVRARVLDFGLAAEIRSSLSMRSVAPDGDTSGTRPYMAPEQWAGRRQDGRADQYALACLAYELLSGAPPFSGVFETGDLGVMSMAVETRAPEPIPGLPAFANDALARALSKSPDARFPSCTAFADALALPSVPKSPRRPRGAVLAVLAVSALCASLCLLLFPGGRSTRPSGPSSVIATSTTMTPSTPTTTSTSTTTTSTSTTTTTSTSTTTTTTTRPPPPGYAYEKGRLVWREGIVHPANEHLVSTQTKDVWEGASIGWKWDGGTNASWHAGMTDPRYPHWVSIEREGYAAPAPGYTKADPKANGLCPLVWKQGKTDKNGKRRASAIQDKWEMRCGDCGGTGSGSRSAPCSDCGGRGSFASKRKCPDCDGRGKESQHITEDCATCDGDGSIPCRARGRVWMSILEAPCSQCGGSGHFHQRRGWPGPCRNPMCVDVMREACTKCLGVGMVFRRFDSRPSIESQHTFLVENPCTQCGGSGHFHMQKGLVGPCRNRKCADIFRERCTKCSGYGFLFEACSPCEGSGVVDCPNCDGSGSVKTTRFVDCRACRGTGMVPTTMTCAKCAGSGSVAKTGSCPTCGGSGWSPE